MYIGHTEVGIGSYNTDVFRVGAIAVLLDSGFLAFVFEKKLFGGMSTVDGSGDAGAIESFEMVGVDMGKEVEERFVEMGLVGGEGKAVLFLGGAVEGSFGY